EPISVHHAGWHEVYGDILRVPGQISSERRSDDVIRDRVVRGEHRPGTALKCRRHLHVDLRYDVRRETLELRQDAVCHMTVRAQWRDAGVVETGTERARPCRDR